MKQRLNLTNDFWSRIYCDANKIDPTSFYGSVLYLGLGDAFLIRKQSPNVTKTVIIENDPNVIQFNYKRGVPDNWEIIEADVYEYVPTENFDIVIVDIWYEVQNKDVVADLVKRYEPYLKENGKIIYLPTIIKK